MQSSQHILERDGTGLYAALHEPEGECRAALLVCPPVFEERKSANRALVEAARALCAAGLKVLRFDYSGCGDSTGNFDSFSIPDWLDDIRFAHHFLKERCPDKPVGIAGLRCGASFAALHAAAQQDCDFTILWEPVLDGETYIKQELRRSLTREMVTFGKNRKSRADLLSDIENGTSVDLDGYLLSARLNSDLCSMDLGKTDIGAKPVLVLNISHRDTLSPALTRLKDTWRTNATFDTVTLQPFWSLVGYVDPAPVIDRTLEWLKETQWKHP